MAKYVWRVEDEFGVSPYTKNLCELERMFDEHNSNRRRWPTPYNEGIPIKNKICGFKTKKEARSWFWGHWQELKLAGFRLKRIRAKNISYGEKQVTFKRA